MNVVDVVIAFRPDGRYASASGAVLACERAQASGTLRQFRVKYLPASCACCGKRFQVGMPVLSPARGKPIGRCCVLDPALWGWA